MDDGIQNHEPVGDGWRCLRTSETARHVFWEGAGDCPPGADYCGHCAGWTPGSRLAELNAKRQAEEELDGQA